MNLLSVFTTTRHYIYSRILQTLYGAYQHQQQWHHSYESRKFWLGDMLSFLEIDGLEYPSQLSPLKEKAALKRKRLTSQSSIEFSLFDLLSLQTCSQLYNKDSVLNPKHWQETSFPLAKRRKTTSKTLEKTTEKHTYCTEVEQQAIAFITQISMYRKDSSNPLIALWAPESNDRGQW